MFSIWCANRVAKQNESSEIGRVSPIIPSMIQRRLL